MQVFPGGSNGRSHLQWERPGFYPWVGKILWRREWLSTAIFLPGKFHGQRSLSGYSPWGHKEFNMTEWLSLHFMTLSYEPWAGNTLMYVNMIPCLWHNTVNKFFISHSITSAVGVFISTFKKGDPIWWLSMKGIFMQKKTEDIKYWKCNMKGHKLESRVPGEISITSDIQMTPPLWQKVKRN